MIKSPIVVFWFRRDLRLEDNHGLYQALNSGLPVLPLFIFDTEILNKLEDRNDPRVQFIHQQLADLNAALKKQGSGLLIKKGSPSEIWKELVHQYSITQVFANRDYEPYALGRDKAVYEFLRDQGVKFSGFKDHVIFEKDELVKKDGTPYLVYTPYSRLWKTTFESHPLKNYPSEKSTNWHQFKPDFPSLSDIGFLPSEIDFPERRIDSDLINNYHNTRDIPSIPGTSRLGVHLRFGTVSIRDVVQLAAEENGKYLNELIWREFYSMLLWHFPKTAEANLNSKYDRLEWENNEAHFLAWCQGRTGYPMVDAGMRELNATGFMHNRVRMITASFLTKHLLIDWRWGEAYFARRLLDYEMASNVGGWQWAAGTGADAAPYFRVFNPATQAEKFDAENKYITKWIPEFDTSDYPEPIIEHAYARNRAIERYKTALSQ